MNSNKKLKISIGKAVSYLGLNYQVYKVLDFNHVLLKDNSNNSIRASINELHEEIIEKDNNSIKPKIDLIQFSNEEWEEAKKRYKIIEPLLGITKTKSLVGKIAEDNNVSIGTIYRWLRVYEETEEISSLVNLKKEGGKGKGRIDEDSETIIKDIIEKEYLNKQRKSVSKVYEIIYRELINSGLPIPHEATVRRRILNLDENIKASKRIDKKYADLKYKAIQGKFSDATTPLSIVQIDHTKVDIILVDDIHRRPLGRPWITVAIDVFSRMIIGYYVSFDPPGAIGTGICLSNAILPKDKTLAKFEISGEWPCWGVMKTIHLDNAKEFHGAMLKRACEEYNIGIDYRAVAKPNWGGHIERLMGTLMREIHTLPGTTFSNPTKRKGYDSEGQAVLNLFEFEKWLLNFIINVYHKKLHSGIGTSPIKKYEEGIFGNKSKGQLGIGIPDRFSDERKIKIDFLPYFHRSILPYGVLIEHIYYYHDVFKNYINNYDKLQNKARNKKQFLFRRDPRDISVIYFWEEDKKQYIEIPYRDYSNPSMSIWEYRMILKELKIQGTSIVDERKIFEAYEKMNDIVLESKKKTTKAKRAKLKSISRQNLLLPKEKETINAEVRFTNTFIGNIKPFEEQDNGTFE